MALNFPSSPSVNQLYPVPAVAGLPIYRWDGEKWVTTAPPQTDAPSDGAAYGRRNAAWDKVVRLLGDTMTGALILNADPSATLGAATKQYVDAHSGAAVANLGSQKIGTTGVNGSATTAMRSDAAPPIDLTLTMAWTGVHSWSNTAVFNGVATFNSQSNFEGQAVSPLQTLTDGATISTWDCTLGQKAKVVLGGAARIMPVVSGAVEGATYYLWAIQDGTGSRTISWTTTGAGSFDFGTVGAPTLTLTASKADLLCFEAVSIAGTLKLRYMGIAQGFS